MKVTLHIIAIIFVLLFTVSIQAQTISDKNEKSEEFISIGDEKFDKYQYRKAIVYYQKALGLVPNAAEVNFKIAESYNMLNEPEEAETWYKRAIADSKVEVPEYLLSYGLCLLKTEKYDEAKLILKRYNQGAEHADPRSANFLNSLDNLSDLYKDSTVVLVYDINGLNSAGSEFSPVLYSKGVIFVSSRNTLNTVGGREYYNIYTAEVDSSGTFINPAPFNKYINSRFHEGPLDFYQNEEFLIFTRNNLDQLQTTDEAKEIKLSLFETKTPQSPNEQIEPKEIKLPNFDYNIAHPAVTENGEKLLFISNAPIGQGGSDIYISNKKNGNWSEPFNFKQINTPGDEMFPVLQNDSILYFASNGHGGLGGFDIFRVNLLDPLLRIYNLGYPMNSPSDDFGVTLDSKGSFGYFSSNRKGGSGGDDIYRFELVKIKFKGNILDADDNQTIEDAVVYYIDNTGKRYEIKSDSLNGFEMNISPGVDYKLIIEREQYKRTEFDLSNTIDEGFGVPTQTSDSSHIEEILLSKNDPWRIGLVPDTNDSLQIIGIGELNNRDQQLLKKVGQNELLNFYLLPLKPDSSNTNKTLVSINDSLIEQSKDDSIKLAFLPPKDYLVGIHKEEIDSAENNKIDHHSTPPLAYNTINYENRTSTGTVDNGNQDEVVVEADDVETDLKVKYGEYKKSDENGHNENNADADGSKNRQATTLVDSDADGIDDEVVVDADDVETDLKVTYGEYKKSDKNRDNENTDNADGSKNGQATTLVDSDADGLDDEVVVDADDVETDLKVTYGEYKKSDKNRVNENTENADGSKNGQATTLVDSDGDGLDDEVVVDADDVETDLKATYGKYENKEQPENSPLKNSNTDETSDDSTKKTERATGAANSGINNISGNGYGFNGNNNNNNKISDNNETNKQSTKIIDTDGDGIEDKLVLDADEVKTELKASYSDYNRKQKKHNKATDGNATSRTDGLNGDGTAISGTSGIEGTNGQNGIAEGNATSSTDGLNVDETAISGNSEIDGINGQSGIAEGTATSDSDNLKGDETGINGTSGTDGTGGQEGIADGNATSGTDGLNSDETAISGNSEIDGTNGQNGIANGNATSGTDGLNDDETAISGTSEIDGTNEQNGIAEGTATSDSDNLKGDETGINGTSGTDGTGGQNGIAEGNATSGTDGLNVDETAISGNSEIDGINGQSRIAEGTATSDSDNLKGDETGINGTSGTDGTGGQDGIADGNATSGTDGLNGDGTAISGTSGIEGTNGQNGIAEGNATSHTDGLNGDATAISGTSGIEGTNGQNGIANGNATSRTDGLNGDETGINETSRTDGTGGQEGIADGNATSRSDGLNGDETTISGTSGIEGTNGQNGIADSNATSDSGNLNGDETGINETSGTDGTGGQNGIAEGNATSGTDGLNSDETAISGTSEIDGTNRQSGIAEGTATSDSDNLNVDETGINGTSGTDGTGGQDGIANGNATSGTDGLNSDATAISGTSEIDGTNGQNGIADGNATSGIDGLNGDGTAISGTSGIEGTNGQNGIAEGNATSGTDGLNGDETGINETSGTDGTNGQSGIAEGTATSGSDNLNTDETGIGGTSETDETGGQSGIAEGTATSGSGNLNGYETGIDGTSGTDETGGQSGIAEGTATSGSDNLKGDETGIDGTSGTDGTGGQSGIAEGTATSGSDNLNGDETGIGGTSETDGTGGQSGIAEGTATSGSGNLNGYETGIDGTSGTDGTGGQNGIAEGTATSGSGNLNTDETGRSGASETDGIDGQNGIAEGNATDSISLSMTFDTKSRDPEIIDAQKKQAAIFSESIEFSNKEYSIEEEKRNYISNNTKNGVSSTNKQANKSNKYYRVQIAACREPMNPQEIKKKYKGTNDIMMYEEDGWYKYAIGEFTSFSKANALLKESKVKDAWIPVYPISINNSQTAESMAYYPSTEDKESESITTASSLDEDQESRFEERDKSDKRNQYTYRVQIAAAREPISESELKAIYNGNRPIIHYEEDGWYKYAIAETNNFFQAKKILLESGLEFAFIPAYRNEQKIPVMKAIGDENEKLKTTESFSETDRSIIAKDSLLFENDEFTLQNQHQNTLEKYIYQLKENSNLYIEVNAYTDIRGSENYNELLSEARAEEIEMYLIEKGISANRIKVRSFGEAKQLIDCKNNDCNETIHRLNRRAELYILELR